MLPHGQPTLETEWSDGGSTWTPTWDVSGNNFEGFQWAIYMHNAFRNGVAGWLNWWCTWSAPDAPLIVVNGTTFEVSARYVQDECICVAYACADALLFQGLGPSFLFEDSWKPLSLSRPRHCIIVMLALILRRLPTF